MIWQPERVAGCTRLGVGELGVTEWTVLWEDWFVVQLCIYSFNEQMSSMAEKLWSQAVWIPIWTLCFGESVNSLYQFSLITYRVDVRLNLVCSKCPINIIINIIL